MKGATPLLGVKNKIMNMCHFKVSPGNVATVTTKKPGKDVFLEEQTARAKETSDPIVVFRRPPPMPPVLGSLIAVLFLDHWLNNRGKKNDDK